MMPWVQGVVKQKSTWKAACVNSTTHKSQVLSHQYLWSIYKHPLMVTITQKLHSTFNKRTTKKEPHKHGR